ncbi:MAG: metallophosphoesterase [Bacteroidales bacterium]|nr:metallophosphoesterase [Candidatus Sodaliphilus limicaballi]
MKKLIVILMSIASCVAVWAAPRTVVVLSDLHVVAPNKAATMTIGAGERKMLKHSALILETVVDSIIARHDGSSVLVTGDLTDRGDRDSHNHVAAQLKRLQDAGHQCYVIPGNHDCLGDVSASDFATIYAGFGYGNESRRDEYSLSYVTDLLPGVTLLAIDSNGDSASNIAWAAGEAIEAGKRGNKAVAMMHHHLVPHFIKEEQVLPTSVVDCSDAARQQLIDAGVHLVLTGHTHIHDAAVAYNEVHSDSLIEMCTGALAGYPLPYRVLEIVDGQVHATTRYVTAVKGEDNMLQLSRERIEQSVQELVEARGRKLWGSIEGKVAQHPLASRFLAEEPTWENIEPLLKGLKSDVQKAYLVVSEGNEPHNDVSRLIKENLREEIMSVIRGIVKPEYHEAVVEMIMPEVETRLAPIIDAVLGDLNPSSTVPVDDCVFTIKL